MAGGSLRNRPIVHDGFFGLINWCTNLVTQITYTLVHIVQVAVISYFIDYFTGLLLVLTNNSPLPWLQITSGVNASLPFVERSGFQKRKKWSDKKWRR